MYNLNFYAEEIKPLITGVKILQYLHYRLEEITPLIIGVKSYIYTLPTGRNYVVSHWRTGVKSYIYTIPTGRNYVVRYRLQDFAPLTTGVIYFSYILL